MKTLFIILSLYFLSFSANAGKSLIGKWHDKSDPKAHIFIFKNGHEFSYKYRWMSQGKEKYSESIGVWETGSWKITRGNGNKTKCNLTIYADTKECCFNYKFIANNLVLSIKYVDDGYSAGMCSNRVLIKQK